jgi:hypothetical protein
MLVAPEYPLPRQLLVTVAIHQKQTTSITRRVLPSVARVEQRHLAVAMGWSSFTPIKGYTVKIYGTSSQSTTNVWDQMHSKICLNFFSL